MKPSNEATFQGGYQHNACDVAALEGRYDDRCDGCKDVPTTNQMDHTTNEDRRKLVAMCSECGVWKHFLRREHTNDTYKGLVCDGLDGCGGTRFHGVVSERTFDPERAKKESAKWLKSRSKKK